MQYAVSDQCGHAVTIMVMLSSLPNLCTCQGLYCAKMLPGHASREKGQPPKQAPHCQGSEVHHPRWSEASRIHAPKSYTLKLLKHTAAGAGPAQGGEDEAAGRGRQPPRAAGRRRPRRRHRRLPPHPAHPQAAGADRFPQHPVPAHRLRRLRGRRAQRSTLHRRPVVAAVSPGHAPPLPCTALTPGHVASLPLAQH